MSNPNKSTPNESPISDDQLDEVAGGKKADALLSETTTNETYDSPEQEQAANKSLFFKKKKFFGFGHGHGHGHHH